MSWSAIVANGGSQTEYAFWENNGLLNVYVKDGGSADFDNTASVVFDYFRRLDVTQSPTSTALDILTDFFPTLVDNVVSYLESYI
jgi:hypothetical protein